MERRLAAILAADVAGYSLLMGADEEGTHKALRAHLEAVVEPAVLGAHGRIVKHTGDGFLAEFASVIDAVGCAVAIQKGMRGRNEGIPADRRIIYRIGVNLGDVMVEGGDIFGDGVNIAARLEQLADPGGILISRPVQEQIRDRLDIRLEDRGEQAMKNIARPVHVFRVALEGGGGPARRKARWALWATAAAAVAITAAVAGWGLFTPRSVPAVPALTALPPAMTEKLSIVVLPIDNVSGDADQDYLAEGITEDLITDLSRISGAFVISRNTSFTYQDKAIDPRQVAAELKVRYVLEGSMRRQGSQVRINVQLTDGETGAQVWAERFDRTLGDVFALQNEVTGLIARTLQMELKEAFSAKVMRGAPKDLDAQDYAIRAWAEIWNRPQTKATNDNGLALVAKALALDPDNAEALATGSYAHTRAAQYNWSGSREASLALAVEMGEKAVALDPRNADAYYVLSFAVGFAGDLTRAHSLIETCLKLNPNHAPAYGFYGWRRMLMGYPEEVGPWIARAEALSPRDPLRAIWQHFAAQSALLSGRFEEARREAERGIALNPQYPAPLQVLAAANLHLGNRAAAEAALARHMALRPNWRVALIREPFSSTAPDGFRRALDERYLNPLRELGLPE